MSTGRKTISGKKMKPTLQAQIHNFFEEDALTLVKKVVADENRENMYNRDPTKLLENLRAPDENSHLL